MRDKNKKLDFQKIFNWKNFFRILTILNTIFLIIATCFFFGPMQEAEMEKTIRDARDKLYALNRIDCLKDELNKISHNDSIPCLEVEIYENRYQCETYKSNTLDYADLKEYCDNYDRASDRVMELYFPSED